MRLLACTILAIALDVDDLVDALRIARAVGPYVGVAKVGLELYSASGPDAITSLNAAGIAPLPLKLTVYEELNFRLSLAPGWRSS